MPEPYQPISLNRYAYVYNSPGNYTDSTGHFIDTLWDIADLGADLSNCLGDTDSLSCYMLPVDVAAVVLPGLTGVGGADDLARTARSFNDEDQIAKIYALLRSTEAGEQIYQTASKPGLPAVIFDDAMRTGNWGYYDKELNLIGLNPIYRLSPPDLGAAALGHELSHRTARWFTGSQSNEFFAHMVEANIWGELQGRTIMASRYTWGQIQAVRSYNRILALANESVDGSALVRYLKQTSNLW